MPTKSLPPHPHLAHLRYQAKDLLKAHAARETPVLQRLREFLPRLRGRSDAEIADSPLSHSESQLAIAREYGFPSWTRLKAYVEGAPEDDLRLPHHERIHDAEFRKAVDLLDAGDAEGLRACLTAHPELVSRRVFFDGGNYFGSPTLLEFVAENPIRHGRLPSNIVQIARTILDAGPKVSQASIDSTLALVASGCVAREYGAQIPLIDLLCDYGGDPDSTMLAALGHGEFAAAEALIRRGARVKVFVAAAFGWTEALEAGLPHSSVEERHMAMALAAQHGHAQAVELLLLAGEDPNRFNPVGLHSHSTPLHQAALAGHLEVVKRLVNAGAAMDVKDILFDGTPLGWARHGGKDEVVTYLESIKP